MTVSDERPVPTAFAVENDAAGASKLKIENPVPTTPATVMPNERGIARDADARHATVVTDVQPVVLQGWAWPYATDAVAVPEPKLRPETVSDAPPVIGPLRHPTESVGASNDQISSRPWSMLQGARPVPTIAATVTSMKPGYAPMCAVRQATEVDDDHIDVAHAAEAAAAESVKSAAPKLRPETVIVEPPLSAEFRRAVDGSGASKEKASTAVPANAVTAP